MNLDSRISARELKSKLNRFWELSAAKIMSIEKKLDVEKGAPVFTVKGSYTSRGWTEWTQGFQYGSALLQFDATGDKEFLELGRGQTLSRMSPHLTHMGVHDHGFNNISTYGNLLRLMQEGRIEFDKREMELYKLALKVSGAVQAHRWTSLQEGGGYLYSFNGPHSLFVDTVRSVRSLMVSHLLGQPLLTENDTKIDLLERGIHHLLTTARYNIYYGEGRDDFDVPGRTAHESIFDTVNGTYRSPSTQQGYSPFSTWTRGLAWAILGFAEELEFVSTLAGADRDTKSTLRELLKVLELATSVTSEYYLAVTAADGIPYWDTGVPGLKNIRDHLKKPADPFNDFEPVDSSAACIAAQGLLRFAHFLEGKNPKDAARYSRAGLIIARTLLDEPYLSGNSAHQGLILHSVYHRPNGWDYIPKGRKIPCGESSMWGDYHARELMVMISRGLEEKPYYKFWPEVD